MLYTTFNLSCSYDVMVEDSGFSLAFIHTGSKYNCFQLAVANFRFKPGALGKAASSD